MSQKFSDNLETNAPKVLDNKNGRFSGGIWRPYNNVAEYEAAYPILASRAWTQEICVLNPDDDTKFDVYRIGKDRIPFLYMPKVDLSAYSTTVQMNAAISSAVSPVQERVDEVNDDLAQEIEDRQDGDAVNADAISAETARAIAAENTKADASSIMSTFSVYYNDLESDHKTYINADLVGKEFKIFQNTLSRFLSGSEYTYLVSGGFILSNVMSSDDELVLIGDSVAYSLVTIFDETDGTHAATPKSINDWMFEGIQRSNTFGHISTLVSSTSSLTKILLENPIEKNGRLTSVSFFKHNNSVVSVVIYVFTVNEGILNQKTRKSYSITPSGQRTIDLTTAIDGSGVVNDIQVRTGDILGFYLSGGLGDTPVNTGYNNYYYISGFQENNIPTSLLTKATNIFIRASWQILELDKKVEDDPTKLVNGKIADWSVSKPQEEITDLTESLRSISSNALNGFIDGHFLEDVPPMNWASIRSFPQATAFTDYPLGTIDSTTGKITNAISARRWSGLINVKNLEKVRFENFDARNPSNVQIAFRIVFIDDLGDVLVNRNVQPAEFSNEINVPLTATYLYHNVYIENILAINYSGYDINGFTVGKTYIRNENFQDIVDSVSEESTATYNPDNPFKLEHLGTKITNQQVPYNTVYRPCVIRADNFLSSPLAKYYIYFSTDHGGGTAIMFATADDIEGQWTYRQLVCEITTQGPQFNSDIETPWVIWESKTKRFLMYWHTGQAFDGLAQNTFISESSNGIDWSLVKKAFNFPARFENGNGHNGYFNVVNKNGLYIGTHVVTGSNMSRFTRAISKDGLNWVSERKSTPSVYAGVFLGGDWYNVTPYKEDWEVTSPKIMAVRISGDLTRVLGQYFEVGESVLGNITSCQSFTDNNGQVYIIISDNGIIDPLNNSMPIQAKALTLFKVVSNKIY